MTNEKIDNVSITYASGGTIPRLFQHAIRLLVSHWYEHRESEIEVSTKPLVNGLDSIINLLKAGDYR